MAEGAKVRKQKIIPCLWFNTQGEEAAKFYVTVFSGSKILEVSRYGENAPMPAGTVLTVSFELSGVQIMALNGGPMFKFSEAVSLSVDCDDQAEVDELWGKLTADGGEEGPCGWLKDKYGLSWQIVPRILPELLSDPDAEKAARVMAAMMQMKKLDVAVLKQAAEPE